MVILHNRMAVLLLLSIFNKCLLSGLYRWSMSWTHGTLFLRLDGNKVELANFNGLNSRLPSQPSIQKPPFKLFLHPPFMSFLVCDKVKNAPLDLVIGEEESLFVREEPRTRHD